MNETNSMGSKVQQGYACKPIIEDKNKPIMFSSMQIFICEGDRCRTDNGESFAQKLRATIKNLNLNYGKNRIKVTRTLCNGSCRYTKFAYIYVNPNAEFYNKDIAYTAWKNVEQFTDKQWASLVTSIQNGFISKEFNDFRVESQVYNEFDANFKH